MIIDEENGIFEDSVAINPNMNSHIIKAFNEDERIQELIRMNMFYGELISPLGIGNDMKRMFTVSMEHISIQILSIREDGESLKLSFKFIDTYTSKNAKERYLLNPNSFSLCVRATTPANPKNIQINLITFDLKYN